MSLFDAPEDNIIIHACNAQGKWRSGIAKEFKKQYKLSYKDYKVHCKKHSNVCGTAEMSNLHLEETHWVGWIITSNGESNDKDNKELIKINTTLALKDLCQNLYNKCRGTYNIDIYSNKFNSGLFEVPWEESELILKRVLEDYPRINWTICVQGEEK